MGFVYIVCNPKYMAFAKVGYSEMSCVEDVVRKYLWNRYRSALPIKCKYTDIHIFFSENEDVRGCEKFIFENLTHNICRELFDYQGDIKSFVSNVCELNYIYDEIPKLITSLRQLTSVEIWGVRVEKPYIGKDDKIAALYAKHISLKYLSLGKCIRMILYAYEYKSFECLREEIEEHLNRHDQRVAGLLRIAQVNKELFEKKC